MKIEITKEAMKLALKRDVSITIGKEDIVRRINVPDDDIEELKPEDETANAKITRFLVDGKVEKLPARGGWNRIAQRVLDLAGEGGHSISVLRKEFKPLRAETEKSSGGGWLYAKKARLYIQGNDVRKTLEGVKRASKKFKLDVRVELKLTNKEIRRI